MTGTQFVLALKSNNYTKNDDFKKIINTIKKDKKVLSMLLKSISPVLESANLNQTEIKQLLTS